MRIPHDLPSTAALLASGGDERLALDAGSGRSRHGCRPLPDDALAALGSATASNISAHAWAAADQLRRHCATQLRSQAPEQVHAQAAALQRQALLRHCGCGPADGVQAVFAASGTDVMQLAARLCQPRSSILVAASETGSGVPLALQGRHFNYSGTDGVPHQTGQPVDGWHGAATFIAARLPDGSVRDPAEVDAEYVAAVDAAAVDTAAVDTAAVDTAAVGTTAAADMAAVDAAVHTVAAGGGSVLLVLTDVSKTGLIAPGIATVQRLQARWPGRLQVLVDACQFRLAPQTVRAYLRLGWIVALTGSKFMGGPTYSGVLLLPPVHHALGTRAALLQPSWPNFGLLLRWEAALAEMARFSTVPDSARLACATRFAETAQAALAARPALQPLPAPAPDRSALDAAPSWDAVPTIFPFLVRGPDGRPLALAAMQAIHRSLQAGGDGQQRFQLGQPVYWPTADGGSIAALRLCLGARLIADIHGGTADPAALAAAALDAVCWIASSLLQ